MFKATGLQVQQATGEQTQAQGVANCHREENRGKAFGNQKEKFAGQPTNGLWIADETFHGE